MLGTDDASQGGGSEIETLISDISDSKGWAWKERIGDVFETSELEMDEAGVEQALEVSHALINYLGR